MPVRFFNGDVPGYRGEYTVAHIAQACTEGQCGGRAIRTFGFADTWIRVGIGRGNTPGIRRHATPGLDAEPDWPVGLRARAFTR